MHYSDIAPQRLKGYIADINAIHRDSSLVHLVKSRQQVDYGAFSAAWCAEDGGDLVLSGRDVHVAQRGNPGIVAEGDILEPDGPIATTHFHGILPFGHRRLSVEHVEQSAA